MAPSGDIVEEGEGQQADEDGTGGRRNVDSNRHFVSRRTRDHRLVDQKPRGLVVQKKFFTIGGLRFLLGKAGGGRDQISYLVRLAWARLTGYAKIGSMVEKPMLRSKQIEFPII